MAIEHRTVIGIALGILMERFDIGRDEAFAYLQRISSTREIKLYVLALELAENHTLLLPGDPGP